MMMRKTLINVKKKLCLDNMTTGAKWDRILCYTHLTLFYENRSHDIDSGHDLKLILQESHKKEHCGKRGLQSQLQY